MAVSILSQMVQSLSNAIGCIIEISRQSTLLLYNVEELFLERLHRAGRRPAYSIKQFMNVAHVPPFVAIAMKPITCLGELQF